MVPDAATESVVRQLLSVPAQHSTCLPQGKRRRTTPGPIFGGTGPIASRHLRINCKCVDALHVSHMWLPNQDYKGALQHAIFMNSFLPHSLQSPPHCTGKGLKTMEIDNNLIRSLMRTHDHQITITIICSAFMLDVVAMESHSSTFSSTVTPQVVVFGDCGPTSAFWDLHCTHRLRTPVSK